MNESQRFYFESHLKVLYNLFRFLGLIHFTFNPSTKQFEHSTILSAVSRVIYNFTWYVYLLCIIVKIGTSLKAYQHTEKEYNGFTSVVAQDDLLEKINFFREYVSIILFVRNYIRLRKRILPAINEVADILKTIQSRTNPRLYVHRHLMKTLFVKLIIASNHARKLLIVLVPAPVLLLHFIWILILMIPILTLSSHVYSQLALISAYTKMNELLVAISSSNQMRCGTTRTLVKKLLSVSHRIHRVKQKLNEIHSPVFVATAIGSSYDICQMYVTLQAVIYAKYIDRFQNLLPFMFSVKFPECITYSFDVYLIGLLSDKLEKAEDEFQSLVMDVVKDRKSMRRDVELMLTQRSVFGLGTVFHGVFKVNRQYAFEFYLTIVFAIALTCLQFFAAEVVYSTRIFTFAPNIAFA